jgi:wyosine [tRNA(Phe)-imidazoG37] synthetase (radical SAM superfamily)
MLDELDQMLSSVVSGRLWQVSPFDRVSAELRRLNDIAFSGDGEPTTHRNFDEIVAACAEVKRRHGQAGCKMVLITNASMFHRPHVQRGLEILDNNNGEIWAKLEAGTEEYFQLVDRTPIRFERILENIRDAAICRPIVLQSLFMRIHGQPPAAAELDAYCRRLNDITAAGGQIKFVQIYTIARRTTESYVEPLSSAEVDAIVAQVQQQTGLSAAAFYGYTNS